MDTYKIVRFYADPDQDAEEIVSGLTLKEAQAHCKDPETSSRTCTSAEGQARTEEMGAWFEAFSQE